MRISRRDDFLVQPEFPLPCLGLLPPGKLQAAHRRGKGKKGDRSMKGNPTVSKAFVAVICVILAAAVLVLLTQSGVRKSALEKAARETMRISEQWVAVQDADGKLAALLFYDPKTLDNTVSVYHRKGLLPGHAFQFGGTIQMKRGCVVKMVNGMQKEAAYFSLNTQKSVQAKVKGGEKTYQRTLNENTPFVLVVPDRNWQVSFYDEAGVEASVAEDSFKLCFRTTPASRLGVFALCPSMLRVLNLRKIQCALLRMLSFLAALRIRRENCYLFS